MNRSLKRRELLTPKRDEHSEMFRSFFISQKVHGLPGKKKGGAV
jgi:hypothetical protein